MKGKTVLVTGANAGIGKITAQTLAQKGARVILICRNAARGQAALAEIRQTTGNQDVHLLLADLAVQAEVRQVAQQVREQFGRLDVLVNNAGGLFAHRQESADGIEMTFALNHLSYFLLTQELLPLLQASTPSRIVNVSSDAHRVGPFQFDDYQRQQKYSSFQAYGESKLANILFTNHLAKRLAETGITVNALHPGFVATNFATNNGKWWAWGMRVASLFALSPEKGAQTSIYLAESADVANKTGLYFSKKKAVSSSKHSHDVAAQERLWALSETLVAKK